jgi:hypothetical protein
MLDGAAPNEKDSLELDDMAGRIGLVSQMRQKSTDGVRLRTSSRRRSSSAVGRRCWSSQVGERAGWRCSSTNRRLQ